VLPEYRLTGGVGGWPQSYRDIRAAVNHLPELLAKLAQPRPVDIVLVGHSAGGHMAVCLARRADLPAGITRVVALAPAAENRRESATSTSSTHAHPRIPPSWRPSAGAVLDRARAAGRVGPVDAKPGQSLDQRAAELNRWITDLLTWRSHVMAAWDARLMTRS
jgi:pimeloyl-ACP methyl ester carboxylesterase